MFPGELGVLSVMETSERFVGVRVRCEVDVGFDVGGEEGGRA